jgi:hypothetical protein
MVANEDRYSARVGVFADAFPGEAICLAVLGQSLARVVFRLINPSDFSLCFQCKLGST